MQYNKNVIIGIIIAVSLLAIVCGISVYMSLRSTGESSRLVNQTKLVAKTIESPQNITLAPEPIRMRNQMNITTSNQTGYIVSPNYPNTFLKNVRAEVHLLHRKNGINLTFTAMNLVDADSCGYESVTIVWTMNSIPNIRTLCGHQVPDPIIIKDSETVRIIYRVGEKASLERGFKVKFQPVDDGEKLYNGCPNGTSICRNRRCIDQDLNYTDEEGLL